MVVILTDERPTERPTDRPTIEGTYENSVEISHSSPRLHILSHMFFLFGLPDPHRCGRHQGRKDGNAHAEPPNGPQALETDAGLAAVAFGAIGVLVGAVDGRADGASDCDEYGRCQVLDCDEQAAGRPLVALGHAAGDEDARGDEGHVGSEGAEGDAGHREGPVAI